MRPAIVAVYDGSPASEPADDTGAGTSTPRRDRPVATRCQKVPGPTSASSESHTTVPTARAAAAQEDTRTVLPVPAGAVTSVSGPRGSRVEPLEQSGPADDALGRQRDDKPGQFERVGA